MASRFKPVSLTHYPQLAVRSGGALIAPPMPELTRRRFHKVPRRDLAHLLRRCARRWRSDQAIRPVRISLTLREQDTRAGCIMKGENPMPNLEEAIRERAYHLWIADGQPEGQADIYWLNAQREILTTSVAPTDTGKKARVARSGKRAGNGYSTNLSRCRAATSSSPLKMPASTSPNYRRPSTRRRNGRQPWKP